MSEKSCLAYQCISALVTADSLIEAYPSEGWMAE
jgi:hypothetical protein